MGENRFATGEARIMVELDRSGAVQKAQVTRSSGDEGMDAIFGALVARLQVDPPTGMNGDRGQHPIYIGYSCGPETHATTLNITGRQNPPIPSVPPPSDSPGS
jgi:TonB family protein